MKKTLFTLLFVLAATIGYGQEYKNALGVRLGYGFEMQYEHYLKHNNFLKCNAGIYEFRPNFLLSCTHNWNCFTWDWTPKKGVWFLSAGVGGSIGAYEGFNVGVAGDVSFGIDFKGEPHTVAIDYRPTIFLLHDAWARGLANVSISWVYHF